jgi:glycosyltransferase involved in cell wall biosynthesis
MYELSILMPCLNEVRTLPACIQKARRFLIDHAISGEILVADNGSTDGSIECAESLGARVIRVNRRGYGAALAAGFAAAKGEYVIMGDSDDSYDFSALMPFVERLREGYDLVMGNRFRGGIAPGAMPLSHRYFGNPVLSAIGRLCFHCRSIGDFYCGLRGVRRELIPRLRLQSTGMEYALEMVVKANLEGVRITEVPTTLVPDGRDRPPHLRSFRDGWRSLRFYLLMSPRWFFAMPGVVLLGAGLLVSGILFAGPVTVGTVTFDYHTLIYSSAAIVLGYQSLLLAAFTKLLAIETGLHPPKTKLRFLERREALERLVLLGSFLGALGLLLGFIAWRQWSEAGYDDLTPSVTIRVVIGSVLLLLVGGQTVLAGCYFGLINLLADRRAQAAELEHQRPATTPVAQRPASTWSPPPDPPAVFGPSSTANGHS